ncbi:MAG: 3-dehydroquinate synthase [Granulosicoccus sp.]
MPSSLAQRSLQPIRSPEQAVKPVIHQASFSVSFNYPVVFTSQVFDTNNPVLVQTLGLLEPEKRHRVLVLIDEGVAAHTPQLAESWLAYAEHYSASIASVGTPIIVPGGESAKDDIELQDRLSQYIEFNGIDRHSYIIAIGGGAMLDAVGLASATAHRGVRLIRMPTTVLAQNDAGIGVKNGINRFGQKNWYGTFSPPFAVINDDQFLQTLGAVDQRAGMAEAVKVALIKDAEFFDWIESNTQALARFENEAVTYLIERCAQLHLQQITKAGDPFEKGTARPLDFGHWAAHRLEKMTHNRLSHGDAVAIGMILDSRYAQLTGLLGANSLDRIIRVLQALGFPLYDPALNQRNEKGDRMVIAGLTDFQRHLGGQLSITLLRQIGVGHEVHTMNADLLEQALTHMEASVNSCA